MRPTITFSLQELREELASELERSASLAEQLRCAHAEIAALRTARDAALKVAAWGGSRRRVEGTTRHEH